VHCQVYSARGGADVVIQSLVDCSYRVAGGGEHWSQRAYSYNGPWKLVMVSAMIFQDLYNYDLSTMSDSSTPQHKKAKSTSVLTMAVAGAKSLSTCIRPQPWRHGIERILDTRSMRRESMSTSTRARRLLRSWFRLNPNV
jgi:hypothetical protein